MATYYVKSSATGANNGTSWVNAFTTLAGAAAVDAAGDTIYISSAHSESTASAVTFALAGTGAAPTKVISVNDGAEPPTAIADGATIATTGASNVTFTGASFYVRGLTFECADETSGTTWQASSTTGRKVEFEDCKIRIRGSSGSSRINFGSSQGVTYWKDVSVRFANSSQGITGGSFLFWDGGSLESGGTSPANLFIQLSPSTSVRINGLDLVNASSSINLFSAGINGVKAVITNSRLPASWSGSLVTGPLTPSERYELYNCDSGDTNYRLHIADYAGSILNETTIVRTGGASNGTTTISWKLVSTANAEYPHITLDTPEIVRWNDTTGSSITVTVETVTDNVTLTDAECWLEVQYLGTSGVPLGTFVSDAKADVLATAANQTSSSETWTTTGLTTPVKQKLSVTFTPQEKGFIHAVVKLAKASTTVYVDPELTVT